MRSLKLFVVAVLIGLTTTVVLLTPIALNSKPPVRHNITEVPWPVPTWTVGVPTSTRRAPTPTPEVCETVIMKITDEVYSPQYRIFVPCTPEAE